MAKKSKNEQVYDAASKVFPYSRGDDSVLNRGSSAERRYLEIMAILLGAKMVVHAITPEGKAPITNLELVAMLGLPQSTSGTTGGAAAAPAVALAGLLKDVDPEVIRNVIVPGAGAVKFSNPSKDKDANGADQVGSDYRSGVKVDVLEVMMLAATAGYLMEKGIGEAIGDILAGAGKVIEGASPEFIRVET